MVFLFLNLSNDAMSMYSRLVYILPFIWMELSLENMHAMFSSHFIVTKMQHNSQHV